ncbi:CesT family type III secretion system chaperone, partial [Pseudomonas aeruginosa]
PHAPRHPPRAQQGWRGAVLSRGASGRRRYPPAIGLDADGRLLLQARLGLDGLDPERLERALAAQVGLLEALAPELEPLPRGLPPQVPVWRP